MSLRTLGMSAAIVTFLLGVGASAHHSFAAEFDETKPVTLHGTLKSVELINPHGWIHIEVKNPDGGVTEWAIEAGAVNQILKAGLRKTDFQIGTEVIVKGFLA